MTRYKTRTRSGKPQVIIMPKRKELDERVNVPIDIDLKKALYEMAAELDMSAAHYIRRAVKMQLAKDKERERV